MKRKILDKSIELFLNYGFKSITLDEIANALGISKKTIYAHYKNKTALVEATTMGIFETISSGINGICELEMNPIKELFAIKDFVMEHLNNEKTSPQYQLQKYYPNLFMSLKRKQFEIMQECVQNNLRTGIKKNLYRKEIDINFISRIYFVGVTGIKDEETFPYSIFKPNVLIDYYLDYHLRAISTKEGLKILEKLSQKK